jgi:hypothetical protein
MRMTKAREIGLLLQVISNTKEKRLLKKIDSIQSKDDIWVARSVAFIKAISANLRSLKKDKRRKFIKLLKECDVSGLVSLLGGISIVMRSQSWLATLPGLTSDSPVASDQLDLVLRAACGLKIPKHLQNQYLILKKGLKYD